MGEVLIFVCVLVHPIHLRYLRRWAVRGSRVAQQLAAQGGPQLSGATKTSRHEHRNTSSTSPMYSVSRAPSITNILILIHDKADRLERCGKQADDEQQGAVEQKRVDTGYTLVYSCFDNHACCVLLGALHFYGWFTPGVVAC